MLVLSRKSGDVVHIGDDVEVIVLDVNSSRVKLGFVAPRHVQVRRGEVLPLKTEWVRLGIGEEAGMEAAAAH